MEKRSGRNNFVREGKDLSGRRAPDSKLASLKSLEATLLRGPSAKGCVMKKTEMSAQALEQRRRTDNCEDNRNARVEQKSQGKTPTEATSADPSSRNTALMFRAERFVAVPYIRRDCR